MTIYDLKPAFQNLLRPLCRRLAEVGVTANQVTVLALIMSVVYGGFIAAFSASYCWPLLGLPVVFLIRMALNAIDGMLAREHGMKTPLGAILNEISDVLSDTALYLPLAVVPGFPLWPVVFVVLLSIVSEMTGVIAIQIGASRRYDGPLGKSDRALVISVLALVVGMGISRSELWLSGSLWTLCVLLMLTIFNRARNALRELKSSTKVEQDSDNSKLKSQEQVIAPLIETNRALWFTYLTSFLAWFIRVLTGATPQGQSEIADNQRIIFYSNHTSHLDGIVLWSLLPLNRRVVTRPVAAQDYWNVTKMRRFIACRIFRAILITRSKDTHTEQEHGSHTVRQSLQEMEQSLDCGESLIIFPEGTRGSGGIIAPFKSGLYHLARYQPDVICVPVYLENLNRILPKGEILPLPFICNAHFGLPIRLHKGESKKEFLVRTHAALDQLKYS